MASAMSVAYAILPNGILEDSAEDSFFRSSALPVLLVAPLDSGVSVTPGTAC